MERDFTEREERWREERDTNVTRLREEEEKLRSQRKLLDEKEVQHILAIKECKDSNTFRQGITKDFRNFPRSGLAGKENQDLKKELEEQQEKLRCIKRQPGSWT